MKKVSFVVAILVSAALAGCHSKKAANNGGGSADMGSGAGSAMAPTGSADGGGAAPAGSGM
jgi:hypothetical protein